MYTEKIPFTDALTTLQATITLELTPKFEKQIQILENIFLQRHFIQGKLHFFLADVLFERFFSSDWVIQKEAPFFVLLKVFSCRTEAFFFAGLKLSILEEYFDRLMQGLH